MSDISELRTFAATEQAEALDDILSRWQHWRQGYQLVRGSSGAGNATNDYQASRQYDDQNGALDDALENAVMRDVDFQISEMSPMHQWTIQAIARSLHAGVAVWWNARLPQEPAAQRRLVDEARTRLTQRLVAAGVL